LIDFYSTVILLLDITFDLLFQYLSSYDIILALIYFFNLKG